MKRTTLRRTGASVATLAALSIGLTACSSEDESAAEETTSEEAPAPAEEEETEAEGAGAPIGRAHV